MSKFTTIISRQEDGSFIAEVKEIPTIRALGATQATTRTRIQALALHFLADRIERGEEYPCIQELFLNTAEKRPSRKLLRKVFYHPSGEYPDSASQALSTTSVTYCTVMIAYIGYWAFNSNIGTPWELSDLIAISSFLCSVVLFSMTPYFATKAKIHGSISENILKARKCYLSGITFFVISLSLSLYDAVTTTETVCYNFGLKRLLWVLSPFSLFALAIVWVTFSKQYRFDK